MKIVVAPGQGSQSEGFLQNWISSVPGFEEKLREYSNVVELDLVELGTKGTEDQIKDTAIAQPLIVASALAAYRTRPAGMEFDGVAGHSVGEFAAAAISGVLTDEQALELVSIRAAAMARASAKISTSMAAIIGGEESEIKTRLDELDLVAANFNGANQLVVAGEKKQIELLVANPPEKARVIELKVAGAFHTPFMEDARQELGAHAQTVKPANPNMTLWSNQKGQVVSDGQEFLELLVSQVTNPVRWDLVMQNFEGKQATIVELPPAGALSGLLKRAVQDCRTVPLKSSEDFEKVN